MKTKLINEYVYAKIVHPHAKNGWYPLHRKVVEFKIMRFLKPSEVVHHINEDKQDNRIENLMLFKNQREHMKFHLKIKQFGFTQPIKTQIKNRWNNE